MEQTVNFFTQDEFDNWLKDNYNTKSEVWIGYYKKSSKIKTISWSDSVDVALCYGWIDGIRESIDDKSYRIRFTPRNPKSVWSAVNVMKVKRLIQECKMRDSGLVLYNQRKDKTGYSIKARDIELTSEYENMIRSNSKAWNYFINLAPSYKRNSIWWIMDAKRKETQLRRLKILIESYQEGLKMPHMRK